MSCGGGLPWVAPSLSALDPPLFVFGSVAEAALLDGKLAASHGDLDVLISRSELELRLLQLGDLGFAAFTVNYEPRPGLPLVYGSTREELVLELSLLDIDPAGHPYFVVSTDNGPVSISMPRDLFQWAPTIIDGVPVHMLSPLALVHIRAGATSTGAFGPPRPERDGTRHSRLVDLFLSNVAPAQLEPTLTPISDRNSKALACASVPGVTPEARRKSNGACSARLGSG